jgi:hypothetical protein
MGGGGSIGSTTAGRPRQGRKKRISSEGGEYVKKAV